MPSKLKPCRHGQMLFLPLDHYVGRSLDAYGEFSEGEGDLFRQLVRPGDTVIEVGANIGAHTVHLARLVGPTGLLLVFEPQRVIYNLLCANLALNDITNTHTYLAAVGREAGSLKIPPLDYAAANNFGGVSLVGAGPGETVPVTTLDAFDLPSLRFIKIDVEGMEAEVLSGARQLIARHRPILYVENDRREKSEALLRLLEELGYNAWWHLTPLFNPANYAGNSENIFPNTASVNLLCLPREMQADIRELRKVSGPTDFWNED